MDGRERLRGQKVIDGRAHGARSAITGRQRAFGNQVFGAVGFDEEAALLGQRLETQHFNEFVCRDHVQDVKAVYRSWQLISVGPRVFWFFVWREAGTCSI